MLLLLYALERGLRALLLRAGGLGTSTTSTSTLFTNGASSSRSEKKQQEQQEQATAPITTPRSTSTSSSSSSTSSRVFARIVSLAFAYMMAQAMALLWVLMLSAALTAVMEISAMVAEQAIAAQSPYADQQSSLQGQQVQLLEASAALSGPAWASNLSENFFRPLATFYVICVTFMVLAKFGKALSMAAWECGDDLPSLRRAVAKATARHPHLAEAMLVPHVLGTLLLLAVSLPLCAPSAEEEEEGTAGGGGSSQPALASWLAGACCNSYPYQYLTAFPRAQRVLKLMLTVSLVQYWQMLLRWYPCWRSRLGRNATGHLSLDKGALLLLSSLVGCLLLSGAWVGSRWASTGAGARSQERDLHLLLAWALCAALASRTLAVSATGKVSNLSAGEMRASVRDLKATVVVMLSMFFLHTCFDSMEGLLIAQVNLMALSLLFPALGALFYLAAGSLARPTWRDMLVRFPVAWLVARHVCQASTLGGSVTPVIVAIHISELCKFFFRENAARDGSDENDGAQHDGYQGNESQGGAGRGVCDAPRHVRLLSLHKGKIPQAESSPPADRRQNLSRSRSLGAGRLLQLQRSTKRLFPREWSSRRLLEPSSFTFIYRGIVRFLFTFLVLVSAFMAACQVLKYVQEHSQWYPNYMRFRTSADELMIERTNIAQRMVLLKKDPNETPANAKKRISGQQEFLRKPALSGYAACEFDWYGLSLVDYALLAELAYFDISSDMRELLQQLFPARYELFRLRHLSPKVELRVPGENYLRRTHAQFVEVAVPSLNLSVVSIRGTDVARFGDLMEDIKMYAEPFLFSLLSPIFPTISYWSDSTASAVIGWLHDALHLLGFQGSTVADYFKPVAEYVRELKAQGRNVVVIGHSLVSAL
jgi:hypothetical protein